MWYIGQETKTMHLVYIKKFGGTAYGDNYMVVNTAKQTVRVYSERDIIVNDLFWMWRDYPNRLIKADQNQVNGLKVKFEKLVTIN